VDVLREARLVDEAFGPDAVQQNAFGEHVARRFDERQKRLHHLRAERDRLAAAHQEQLVHVELERTELVDAHGALLIEESLRTF
jgi:hypothetical protein